MEDGGQYQQQQQQQRLLAELFGVDEDAGLYVLIAGLVLVGLTVTACCYCKVYDPLRLWTVKKVKEWRTKQAKEAEAPPPEAPMTPERRHWYLNKTLQIDREDRDELGPKGQRKGLQGGWYGARNGGFEA